MSGRERQELRFVRALERALGEHRDSLAPLSARDYERAVGWYRAGVPLGLITEVLDELADSSRKPLTLHRAAPAVDEAWTVVREGRAQRREKP